MAKASATPTLLERGEESRYWLLYFTLYIILSTITSQKNQFHSGLLTTDIILSIFNIYIRLIILITLRVIRVTNPRDKLGPVNWA